MSNNTIIKYSLNSKYFTILSAIVLNSSDPVGHLISIDTSPQICEGIFSILSNLCFGLSGGSNYFYI